MDYKRAHGLTLVELMVAITVALILMAAVIELFVGNKQAYRLQEGSAGLNENSRFVRQQLEYALRMAGHWGGATPQDTQPAPLGNIGSMGCPGAPVYAVGAGTLVGLEGFDAANALTTGAPSSVPPLDCGLTEAGYKPGTDVLVVRFADAERLCLPGQQPSSGNQPFSEAACLATNSSVDGTTPLLLRSRIGSRSEIFLASDADALYGTPRKTANPALLFQTQGGDQNGGTNPELSANYRFFYEVFFVTQCGTQQGSAPIVCDERANSAPTLARLRLRGDDLVAEDVVEGVEALEFLYGIDDDGDAVADRFLSANAIRAPANSSAGGAAGSLWNRVVAIRVGMLIRNPQRDMALATVAPAAYRLPGREITVPESERSFPRKSVVFTVQARNTTRNQR